MDAHNRNRSDRLADRLLTPRVAYDADRVSLAGGGDYPVGVAGPDYLSRERRHRSVIYRVENRDGWGPWSAMETADYPWYDDKGRSRHNTFPRPEIDIGIREHVPFCGWWDRARTGVESIAHVFMWFDEDERRRLHNRGFFAASYDPRGVLLKGQYQVVFDSMTARRIGVQSLLEIKR